MTGSTQQNKAQRVAGKKDGAFFHRLYSGTGAFDIIGKRKRFYVGFALLLLVCIVGMGVRNFNFGIDFTGGTELQMPASSASGPISVDQAKTSFLKAVGKPADSAQSVGTGPSASIEIRTADLNTAQTADAKQGLFNDLKPVGPNGQSSTQVISDTAVSGSWGGDISQQALIALMVFLVLVAIFLAFYFEKWMALAAIIALFNDIVITAGVYALVHFEVTPATVIGLLTILGFSLYDTVVVFDKVRENTRGLLKMTRRTYAEAANLALNQTLMRSINTSLIALLPVLGLLVVGVGILGTGTLTDLALVQLVGMISGALSSICLATPLLVDLKMTEQPFKQHTAKVMAKRRAMANKGAGEEDELDVTDDGAVAGEVRKERAMAAASAVPARHGKTAQRPAGKNARPTGKKRR